MFLSGGDLKPAGCVCISCSAELLPDTFCHLLALWNVTLFFLTLVPILVFNENFQTKGTTWIDIQRACIFQEIERKLKTVFSSQYPRARILEMFSYLGVPGLK